MKLMTKELERQFEKYPIGSQDGLLGDSKVIVKYFNPAGVGTWLITEGNKLENGDYELFGYCHLGDDQNAEFGYVMLSQLEELQLPFGLKIERDMYLPKDFIIKLLKKVDPELAKLDMYLSIFSFLVFNVRSFIDSNLFRYHVLCKIFKW